MSDQNSIEAAGFRFTDDELIDNPELREQIEAFIEIGREEKRRRCMTDLLFLGREILGYKDLTDETEAYKHVELMLDRKGAYARPFNLILIPRDTLKTTLISITKNIQRIIRDGNVRILITNAVMDNARKMLHEIKAHLSENPKFIDLFGNMKGKIWREDEITVSTRTVSCKEMTVEISSESIRSWFRHASSRAQSRSTSSGLPQWTAPMRRPSASLRRAGRHPLS